MLPTNEIQKSDNHASPIDDLADGKLQSISKDTKNENDTNLNDESFKDINSRGAHAFLIKARCVICRWRDQFADTFVTCITKCQPIVVLFIVALLTTLAFSTHRNEHPIEFLTQFTGVVLVLFSVSKLADINGFYEVFSEYDLVTVRWPSYGYWFPILEFSLGLGFIIGYAAPVIALLTVLMTSVCIAGLGLALVNNGGIQGELSESLPLVKLPLGSTPIIESLTILILAVVILASSFWHF